MGEGVLSEIWIRVRVSEWLMGNRALALVWFADQSFCLAKHSCWCSWVTWSGLRSTCPGSQGTWGWAVTWHFIFPASAPYLVSSWPVPPEHRGMIIDNTMSIFTREGLSCSTSTTCSNDSFTGEKMLPMKLPLNVSLWHKLRVCRTKLCPLGEVKTIWYTALCPLGPPYLGVWQSPPGQHDQIPF